MKELAVELGFDLAVLRRSTRFPSCPFIKNGSPRAMRGRWTYLHRTASRRADVREVMPGARSVISLGMFTTLTVRTLTEIAALDAP